MAMIGISVVRLSFLISWFKPDNIRKRSVRAHKLEHFVALLELGVEMRKLVVLCFLKEMRFILIKGVLVDIFIAQIGNSSF